MRVEGSDFLGQFYTAHTGHADIGKNEVTMGGFENLQRFVGGACAV